MDDLIIAVEDESYAFNLRLDLVKKYSMKDLGILTSCLGIEIKSNDKGIYLSQHGYLHRIAELVGISNIKKTESPMATNFNPFAFQDSSKVDESVYRGLIGALLWISNSTRPDISFSTHLLARFCKDPRQIHWTAAIRVFCYLASNKYSLFYPRNGIGKLLYAYVDADFANCLDTRRSVTGYLIYYNGCLISWSSKQQSLVVTSTCEAEIVAFSTVIQELKWIIKIIESVQKSCKLTLVEVYEDNQSTIAVLEDEKQRGRTKHIDIKYLKCREEIRDGVFKIIYCHSPDMNADMMTKALPAIHHERLTKKSGLCLDQ